MTLVPVTQAKEDTAELRGMMRRFRVNAALTAPLAFIAMAPYLSPAEPLRLAPHTRMYAERPARRSTVRARSSFAPNASGPMLYSRRSCAWWPQAQRAPVQQLADLVAAWFVQAVIAIAIVTSLVWWFFGPEPRLVYALVNAVAVLIIACHCAVGLATPISITVAMGQGALNGILFHNAEAVGRLREVDTPVVDKTGSLTVGRPELVDFVLTEGSQEEEHCGSSQALSVQVSTPLTVVRGAEKRGAKLQPVKNFESITGQGVQGEVNGHKVAVGGRRFMETHGKLPQALARRANKLRSQGKTALLGAIDGRVVAVIAVADPIEETTQP